LLVSEITSAVDDWQELDETIEQLADAPEFRHLKFYDSWHKRNISRTFVQMERAR
ncbi:MAG: MBL fold metallo-hydrolase, partial [Gammaproteobacteria bacterium]|nr:MBL fold metallo-hydrolase [Gammaproteobacteria bacterium]